MHAGLWVYGQTHSPGAIRWRDPLARRPARIPRRKRVDAILFNGRAGIQRRYLPGRHGARTAVWAWWHRWRASGVWPRAMTRLFAVVRWFHDREPLVRR